MNRPRRLFFRSINVRCGGRHYQQLVLAHFMPPFRDLAPAIPLGTVYENRFRASTFPHADVPLGLWIISRVRRQQLFEQWILQSRGQDWPWHYHETLPSEPLMLFSPLHKQSYYWEYGLSKAGYAKLWTISRMPTTPQPFALSGRGSSWFYSIKAVAIAVFLRQMDHGQQSCLLEF